MKISLAYSSGLPELANEELFLELSRQSALEAGLRLQGGILQLILLDVEEMSRLNALHLGHEGPTDVISYDLRSEAAWQMLDEQEPPVAAEIYLCPAIAKENAALYGNSASKELLLYAIHGMLHLCGEDDQDEEERRAMQRKQEAILAKIAPPNCNFL